MVFLRILLNPLKLLSKLWVQDKNGHGEGHCQPTPEYHERGLSLIYVLILSSPGRKQESGLDKAHGPLILSHISIFNYIVLGGKYM